VMENATEAFESYFATLTRPPKLSIEIFPIAHTKKATRIKYTCRCNYSVWGRAGLDIFCGDCDGQYKEIRGHE
jgi:hypothetical protein